MSKNLLKGCEIYLIWPAGGFKGKSWSRDQLKGWVKHAGGHLRIDVQLSPMLTHLVCGEPAYIARKAFKAELKSSAIGPGVKIVSLEWLAETLTLQKKQPIGPYLWSKLIPTLSSTSDMMQLFEASTAPHVNPAQQKALNAQLAAETTARIQRETEERHEAERKKKEDRSKIYARGGHGSSSQAFAGNNHIFVASDGFQYQVSLWKVNMDTNTNERVTLTIYETNDKPYTYATYILHEKTLGVAESKSLVALGANYPTALRQFTMAFAEFTGIAWNDRFELSEPAGPHHGFKYNVPKRVTALVSEESEDNHSSIPVDQLAMTDQKGAKKRDAEPADFQLTKRARIENHAMEDEIPGDSLSGQAYSGIVRDLVHFLTDMRQHASIL